MGTSEEEAGTTADTGAATEAEEGAGMAVAVMAAGMVAQPQAPRTEITG